MRRYEGEVCSHAVAIIRQDESFYYCKNTRSARKKERDETIKIAKSKNPSQLNEDWSFLQRGFIIDFRVEKIKPHTTEVESLNIESLNIEK